ncbi:putative signal peptidase complex subunit 2 [Morella rubra]|uniref:Signal peptidase complex subunit 2 n=1 Tax=Morella rubra TaxID=262757 RepID=A0A6A1W0C6_9ROSI|nr:putative signal peptidase complex subunit 2 [Morella rubra]KAB1217776.1 putative signal peptidase complex subunit 2 [Morella rubra]
MQEKKPEKGAKNAKKANLLDHHSIKHILDESVSEIVTSRGYVEDVRMSNIRLLIIYTKEKNAILFTYPPVLSSTTTKKGRFTKDGVLVEGLFWRDVETLIDEYIKEPKKGK